MAKLKNTDVSEKDVFRDVKKSAEKTIAVLKVMEDELRKNLEQQKKFSQGFKAANVSDIKKLAKAQDEVKKSVQGLNEVEKEKLRLEAQLKKANSSKAGDLAQLRLLTQEQNKNVKEQARLELEELGVIKKSAAERRKEAAERRKAAREIEIQNKKLAAETRKAAKEIEIESNAFKKLTRDTNKAQAEFKRLAAQFGVNSKQAKAAKLDFDKLDGRLRTINNAARDGRRDVGRYGIALKGLGNTLRTGLGFLGLTAGIAGVARLITSSVAIFKDFEAANSKLKSVLGATKEEMKFLSDQAKELGSVTSFTASQVTDLQTEFAKLGFPTQDILNMTASTLDAAAAMGSQLGEQAALTGATIKAFGLSSKDAARINDVLAKSTARSALDFSKLNASMSTIAPVANALGFGLEDTVALLGNLSDSGFDASTAATATRNIMLKLADSSSVLGRRLKEPVKDLPSLVKGLRQLSSEGVDLSEALELTDVRSVAAFSTFLKGTDSLERLSAELNNANGSAKEMADTMLNNLSGDITKATSAWEGFVLSLEDGEGVISKALRSITQFATETLSGLTLLNKSAEQLAVGKVKTAFNEFTKAGNEAAKLVVEDFKKIGLSGDAMTEALNRAADRAKENFKAAKGRKDLNMAASYFSEFQALKELINPKKADTEETIKNNKAKEDAIKIAKDYSRELEDVQNRLIKNDLDREIAQVETEFNRKIEAIKGNGKIENKLREELRREKNRKEDELISKHQQDLFNKEQERAKAQNKILDDLEIKSMEDGVDKEKALRQQQFEEKIAQLEKDGLLTAEIEAALKTELLNDLSEIQKKSDKELDDARQEQADKFEEEQRQKRIEAREKTLAVIEQLEKDFFERRKKEADKEVNDTKEREKNLQYLANKGIQDAKDSLAQNQKDQAEAEKKKEDLLQKEKQAEIALALIKAFNAELDKGADTTTALAKALVSQSVLVAAASSLPAFEDGIENTGENGKGVDGKGGFLAVLHPNERVVPKIVNDKLDGISNKKLGELADNGMLSYALNSQSMGVQFSRESPIEIELKRLYQSNQEIVKAIDRKPVDMGWNVDDVRKIVSHKIKEGNKTTKINYKL